MEEIKSMYLSGLSSIEIAEKIGKSPRQVQRYIASMGIVRDTKERFINAIKRGRMLYTKMPLEQLKQRKYLPMKLRYQILNRDAFKCVQCGNTASEARIQVDHIDGNPSNNSIENLQTLCELCNKGKAYL